MNQLQPGIKVIARDHMGMPHIRVLWDLGERCIYICAEDQYRMLMGGEKHTPAIGFPKEDVFEYSDSSKRVVENYPILWDKLKTLIK